MYVRVFTAGAIVAAALIAPSPALAQQAAPAAPELAKAPLTVVTTQLNNPRGLAFGPDGALYVAEAGKGGVGPCLPGPEGLNCFGTSGSLARIKNGVKTRVLTGLPSMAHQDGTNAIGPSDVTFLGLGALTIGLGADPAVRNQLPAAGKQFAGVYAFVPGPITPKPTLKKVADIGAYEQSVNPDGGEVDTNPQSVAFGPGGMAVSDAGGNALLGVSASGAVKTLAVFPERCCATAPPFLGLPPGTQIPFQAVPTGVAYHQGAYYVTQLTGFPFPANKANIYRVVPGKAPVVVASGLTNVIDVAVAGNGTVYALEIAHDTLLSPAPSGRLLKIRPGQSPLTLAAGLTFPGGLTLHQGYAYVSDCGICAGGGRVVRLPL
ncbi:MAG: ScyD/ScyE family protein [Hamadaea sp.]|nr:ScyD/ScyE family protein [Hamadaea sp.]